MDGAGSTPGSLTPPAGEWKSHWSSTLPRLQQLARQGSASPSDVAISRSSQADAARLDEELSGMLREQFSRVFALFQPGVIASLQAELTLLLDLLIFWFSIRQGKPLPGMALMNLRHRDERAVLTSASSSCTASDSASIASAQQPSLPGAQQQLPPPPRLPAAAAAGVLAEPSSAAALSACQAAAALAGEERDGGGATPGPRLAVGGGLSGVEGPGLSVGQRVLYCLGGVVLKYGWARLTHHAATRHWGDASQGSLRQKCWALLRHAESGYRLAALLNFLVFLWGGRYRSLLERMLRARLVYARPSAARAISFEYLNRQLVWAELSELLLFLLPLVDVGAIKRALRAHLPRLPMLAGAGAAAATQGSAAGEGGGWEPCGICNAVEVLSPWAARPCGHTFCYYCLRSHCLAVPQYTCPICLTRVEAMQRCVGVGPPAAAAAATSPTIGSAAESSSVGQR